MSQRKKWTGAAKFEIVLQVLKGEKTLHDVCRQYEVAPSQVHSWRKEFLEKGSLIFGKSDKADCAYEEMAQQQKVLYEMIGQLTMERDFLKKAWGKYQKQKN